VYALPVLPVLLHGVALYSLHEMQNAIFAWVAVFLMPPLYYLLFITLSALEQYQTLPSHVGRIILNLLTLFTAFVGFTYAFQSAMTVWVGMIFVFVFSWFLTVQALLWWSNANVRYSVFYATLLSFLMSLVYLSLFLWPLGYLVTGLMMLLAFYVLIGMVQNYFKKSLQTSVVAEHIIVAGLMTLLILSQVHWIPLFQ
jgi:hypothetical protein